MGTSLKKQEIVEIWCQMAILKGIIIPILQMTNDKIKGLVVFDFDIGIIGIIKLFSIKKAPHLCG